MMPGPDDETPVVHRLPAEKHLGTMPIHPNRKQPLPELGEHVLGPRMLASNERAAIALRAVYGYSWGLEVEIRAVRAGFIRQDHDDDPAAGLLLALAPSKEELELSPPHGVASHGQPGYETTLTVQLMARPYPGSLWLGWAWPELGIAERSIPLVLPDAGSFAATQMLSTSE